jgi:transketolase
MKKNNNKIVVVVGDGELNEGSNWEACLVAAAHHLDNLTIIVDRNHLQANCRTEELIPLEPLNVKFEAFGCRTARIDGHNFQEIDHTFISLPFSTGRPNVVIADTVRGQGIPSLQGRTDKWFMKLDEEEFESLKAELWSNTRLGKAEFVQQ